MIKLNERDERRALRLHREACVVDTHCDTLQAFFPDRPSTITPLRLKSGLGKHSDKGHIDIPRMIEGGVNCQVFAIFTVHKPNPPKPLNEAVRLVDIFHSECEKNYEKIAPVHSYDEIVSAHRDGKIAAILSLEGAEAIEADIGILRMLYKLGVRMMSLTWNHRNQLADGVGENRTKSGLTNLGVSVVEEMKKLGMVIDVSHLSDSCFWSLIEIVKGPIIASHSNSRALCKHRRNLTDDQIKALAETGGVIGMCFAPSFICSKKATVERLVDHIDHITNLVGVEYVGLGSDFDGIRSTPEGLEDVTRMPNITKVLVSRGYSDDDVMKILGGNNLRVFKKVLR